MKKKKIFKNFSRLSTLLKFSKSNGKAYWLITHTNTFETSLNLFRYFFISIRLCTRWVWLIILYESLGSERERSSERYLHLLCTPHTQTDAHTDRQIHNVLLCCVMAARRSDVQYSVLGCFHYSSRLLISIALTIQFYFCVSTNNMIRFFAVSYQKQTAALSMSQSFLKIKNLLRLRRAASIKNSLNLCSQTSWHEFMY